MDILHAEMLRSLGLQIPDEDVVPAEPPRTPSPILPNRPHHMAADGLPVYTTEQIKWADPSQFGYHDDYYVVEEEHSAHPLALNWSDEMNLPKKRPVHRYKRSERFRFILGQLMGCSGHVPSNVLKAMNVEYIKLLPDDQIWDYVRSVLKSHGWRIFYNRIPAILSGLGIQRFRFSDTNKFQDILHDFDLMDRIFASLKPQLGRTYFPNLRFIAIKLMHRHGLSTVVPIPLARTSRKCESLEEIYNLIWNAIEEQKLNDFISSLQ